MPEGKGLTPEEIEELLNSDADESISRRIQRREESLGRRETRKERMQMVFDVVPENFRSRAAEEKSACPIAGGKRLIRKQFFWRARQDSNPRPPGS